MDLASHAALAVVIAHDNSAAAALRERVALLEQEIRCRADEICWEDRMKQALLECGHSREQALQKFYDLLLYAIEQQSWGLASSVADLWGVAHEAESLVFFHREYHVELGAIERALAEEIIDDLYIHDDRAPEFHPLDVYIRRAEDRAGLPRGSLSQLRNVAT